jgi:hypothetical protein
MYIGFVLVAWIVIGIALVAWVHLRSAPQGHDGYRRKRIRPQAVAAPGWSRSLPSVRAR